MLINFLFSIAPVAAIVFFICSLVAYIGAKRKNASEPNSFTSEQIRKRKTLLIVSSIIFGVLLALIFGIIALLAVAIIFM